MSIGSTCQGKKASVVIGVCTFNRAGPLRRCLESLLKLQYSNYKIVVVDNNSTDDTAKILKGYPQITCLVEEKQGIACARNKFLEYCSWQDDVDYIGFIDDDETVPEDWIDSMLGCMQSNEEIAVACGPCVPIYYEVNAPPIWLPDGLHNANQYKQDINAVYKEMDVLTGNCFVRYRIIKASNISFNERLGRNGKKALGGEDTDFFLRLVYPRYLYGFTKKAPIFHWIEADRLTMRYCIKRYFWQGVSEYYIKGWIVLAKSFFKIILQVLHLLISLCTFNKRYIVNRFLKVVKTIGIIVGPIA